MLKRILLAAMLALSAAPAYAIPPYVTQATIASGQSLSTLFTLDPFAKLGPPHSVQVIIPAAWTTADLTVLICAQDGTGCLPLYDGAKNEYTIGVSGASTIILLDPAVLGYISYFKLRSGTAGSPVAQGAARTLTVNLY